jgi:acyl carrier protein phosphodiesterase
MNLLAHAYLSFGKPEILVGNMISDFVKGKTKFDFDPAVQSGISLHRAIDEFTDVHPATKKAKEYFRPSYRLYSGAFVDVVYDHFLALDKNEFPGAEALHAFTLETYDVLQQNFSILPARLQSMLPHMIEHNWLFNYSHLAGVERSFGGLRRRAHYITETSTAFTVFNESYSSLQECYSVFFPSLKKFALSYLDELAHG